MSSDLFAEEPKRGSLAAFAVRLAALWILAGGLFKLLYGSPADLPPSTRLLDDLVLQYEVYIAVELAVGLFALVRPGLAWPLIAGAFAVFEFVLIQQMAAGAESCGCFGSKVPIKPWQMATIDGVLLLFLLISRPWRIRGLGGPVWLAGLVAAIGAVLPFVYSREVTEPGPNDAEANVASAEEGAQAEDGGAAGQAEPKSSGGGLGRGFVSLDVEDWVGQSIDETPLAKWIEGGVEMLPLDGLWVLWRADCDHCKSHLEDLTFNPPPLEEAPFITLVQLKQPHDTEANRVVHTLPDGGNVMQATCPDSVDYILTTPGEIWLEAGVVVRAVEGAGSE